MGGPVVPFSRLQSHLKHMRTMEKPHPVGSGSNPVHSLGILYTGCMLPETFYRLMLLLGPRL
jgi:hypothetical protein